MADTKDDFAIHDSYFVTAHGDAINASSVTDAPSAVTVEADPAADPGAAAAAAAADTAKKPSCPDCGMVFETYSKLFAHQGSNTCDPTRVLDDEPMVTIHIGEEAIGAAAPFVAACGAGSSATTLRVPARTLAFTLDRLMYARCNAYNLETWYDAVAPGVTAPSVFVPLADDEVDLLSKLYGRGEFQSSLSRGEATALSQLEARVQGAMDAAPFPSPYFVRLSTRSPKDAVTGVDGASLCVPDAMVGVGHIASSMRCATDLRAYLKYRTPGAPGDSMNIIVRAWQDMDPELEFRCFVAHGVLTAITQYDCYVVVEALQDPATVEAIRDTIVDFHAALGPSPFPVDSYVLDVHVQPNADASAFAVSVIELNPFGAELSSGSGLFSWTRDRDLLYNARTDAADADADTSVPAIRVLRCLTGRTTRTRIAPSALLG